MSSLVWLDTVSALQASFYLKLVVLEKAHKNMSNVIYKYVHKIWIQNQGFSILHFS